MSSFPLLLVRVNQHSCQRLSTFSHHCARRYVFSALKNYLSKDLEPPKPPKYNRTTGILHGKERTDEFSWMQNIKHPGLLPYMQEENAYTKRFMRKHRFLQRTVLQEMKNRLQVQKSLPPLGIIAHGYEYYTRTSPFGIVYLRKEVGSNNEQVLLNAGFLKSLNMTIRKVLLSPNHNIFAYNTEQEGMEYGDLHLKDLISDREFEILHDVFNFTWANEETIYYTIPNEQLRPYRVFGHHLGTDQKQDILIYEETNESAFVDVTTTKDLKFVTINSNSLSSSEVRIVDATHTLTNGNIPTVHLVQPRQSGLEYYVDHHEDTFYILTNADGATNFKLAKTKVEQLPKRYWKDVVTTSPTEKIEDVDIFQNYIVIYGRREGLPMILCHDFQSGETFNVQLPEEFCVVHPGTNTDFNTNIFRFSITSPFAHESTFDYDMSNRKLIPVRLQPIHRFDRSEYTCTRIYAKSADGKSIPMTLLHRKNLELNGRNPVLMRSYGAYGISTDPDFRVEHFPLLERGWVVALPHVRGGSELGKDWYREGRSENKMNSFKDFICAAEHLIHSKITSPQYLSAIGTSAGGLLVGAMINMRPDLFKALVLRVPFVDPLSAMLDPALPLTQMEYPEWGNPVEDPKAYELISSYSPYENIGTKYNFTPSLYITAGLKDQRVAYWQPLKLTARIRQSLPSKSVLLKLDEERGHFGAGSEQEVRLSEAAEQVAFLISQVQRL